MKTCATIHNDAGFAHKSQGMLYAKSSKATLCSEHRNSLELRHFLSISFSKGAFNNYADRFLDFFDHPPTPSRQME